MLSLMCSGEKLIRGESTLRPGGHTESRLTPGEEKLLA